MESSDGIIARHLGWKNVQGSTYYHEGVINKVHSEYAFFKVLISTVCQADADVGGSFAEWAFRAAAYSWIASLRENLRTV